VSLFQRIKTPFSETAEDHPAPPQNRTHAVGALLRERREELGFDLDAIGEALRIKPIYLAALEQGRGQDLPGATYAIGFIRTYAELLGLDSDRILDSTRPKALTCLPDRICLCRYPLMLAACRAVLSSWWG